MSIETTLGDAISDLLRGNGEIESPDSKSFKAGIYSGIRTSYQQLMRVGIDQDIPDSHRFPRHRPDIVDKFRVILNTCRKIRILICVPESILILKSTP
ncbi:hypothetical protein ACIXMT_11850 [Bacteroides fragilis]